MNVVTTVKCPFCNCDPCDCDWGLNELFKNGNAAIGEPLDKGSSSSGYYPSIEDLRLPVFDSVYNSLGAGGASTYKQRNKSVIIDRSVYKIGDLVNWYPMYGLFDIKKIWLVKDVFPDSPLDCSFYDYEITDGAQTHLVTFSELRKLEDK